ncbi:C40 family peptidase [Xanthocytophaga agilis]|uniref:C40 family peptidase n=1 Tax=Xanthocytophaga agilis TaxID=3048010 RepID=A0AAE3UH29_9BACT|nr:C40 family peptidase [Xanthocytophaga agilis]MDJ1502218.1 C40 family peptidase [Xanthocytophaga agilis]
MQRIANQFWIVLQEIAKLFWIIVCEIAFLLARAGKYLYAHRKQIATHRATPWVIIALATVWSVWAMYRHVQQQQEKPIVVTRIPTVLISDSDFQQRHIQLTGQPPLPESNKALTQSITEWIGVPYRDNSDSRTGTDCSGFVRNVYQEAYGLNLNRNALKMYEQDVDPIEKEELHEGDLIFFDTFGSGISHVGIYLQNGRFAHASTSRGVTIDSLTNPYYSDCYYSSGRVNREFEEDEPTP